MLTVLLLVLTQQSVPVDAYAFSDKRTNITVTVTGSFRETSSNVAITTAGRTFKQKLSPSSGSHFINRKEWIGNNWSRPSVGIVWVESSPILWCLQSDLTGVYEYAEIKFWRWNGSSWNAMPSKDLSFSNRGGFFVDGNILRLFDFIYDTGRAHWDSHAYSLKEYKIEKNSISLVSSRQTKRRYSPEGDAGYPVPEIVEPKNDPLREFGLQWKWWGPRNEGRQRTS